MNIPPRPGTASTCREIVRLSLRVTEIRMGIFFGIIAVSTGSALAVIFAIKARAFGSWIASWEKLSSVILPSSMVRATTYGRL